MAGLSRWLSAVGKCCVDGSFMLDCYMSSRLVWGVCGVGKTEFNMGDFSFAHTA